MYFFNKEMMARQPDWAQAILRNAAKLAAYNMTSAMFDGNAANWDIISKQFPNVQIREFPPEVISALRESNRALIELERARSPIAKKIIDSREQYLRKARAWSKTGDQLYINSVAD